MVQLGCCDGASLSWLYNYFFPKENEKGGALVLRKCVAFFSKRKSSAVALTGEEEPRLNLKELELEPQIVQKSSTLPDATWPEQDLVGITGRTSTTWS